MSKLIAEDDVEYYAKHPKGQEYIQRIRPVEEIEAEQLNVMVSFQKILEELNKLNISFKEINNNITKCLEYRQHQNGGKDVRNIDKII